MAHSVELTAYSSGRVGHGANPGTSGYGSLRSSPARRTRLLLLVGPRVPPTRGIDVRLTAMSDGFAAPGRGRSASGGRRFPSFVFDKREYTVRQLPGLVVLAPAVHRSEERRGRAVWAARS